MSPWRSLDEVVGPSRTGWASYCQFNLALRVHIPGSSLEYSHLNEFWTTLWGWAGRTWRHYQTSGVFRDRVEAQRLCVYCTYSVELLSVCRIALGLCSPKVLYSKSGAVIDTRCDCNGRLNGGVEEVKVLNDGNFVSCTIVFFSVQISES